MTRERDLLRHLIFQTNEGDVVVASKQKLCSPLLKLSMALACNQTHIIFRLLGHKELSSFTGPLKNGQFYSISDDAHVQ
jgi:hypothetical protein